MLNRIKSSPILLKNASVPSIFNKLLRYSNWTKFEAVLFFLSAHRKSTIKRFDSYLSSFILRTVPTSNPSSAFQCSVMPLIAARCVFYCIQRKVDLNGLRCPQLLKRNKNIFFQNVAHFFSTDFLERDRLT